MVNVAMNAVDIGLALRAARKRLGITQSDAADLAGISERTVRDVEKGKDGADVSAYLRFAEVVGLSLERRAGGVASR